MRQLNYSFYIKTVYSFVLQGFDIELCNVYQSIEFTTECNKNLKCVCLLFVVRIALQLNDVDVL